MPIAAVSLSGRMLLSTGLCGWLVSGCGEGDVSRQDDSSRSDASSDSGFGPGTGEDTGTKTLSGDAGTNTRRDADVDLAPDTSPDSGAAPTPLPQPDAAPNDAAPALPDAATPHVIFDSSTPLDTGAPPDNGETDSTAPPPTPDTSVTLAHDTDEGFDVFRIQTADATYYFDKVGGGLSSLVDSDGHDWISYNSTQGFAGTYRGIPNMGAHSFSIALVNSRQHSVLASRVQSIRND